MWSDRCSPAKEPPLGAHACESGCFGHREELDPTPQWTIALVRNGLPAVVAMRLSIADQAALRFCRDFSRSPVAGEPEEAAVAAGRLRVAPEARPGYE